MSKIIGNTVATPRTVPDWNQDNPNRADYIKNKPEIVSKEYVDDAISNVINHTQSPDGNWENVEGIYKTGVCLHAPKGSEVSSGSYNTRIVDIEEGFAYRVTFATSTYKDAYGVAFYKEDGTFISFLYPGAVVEEYRGVLVDIPEGAKKMKVSTFISKIAVPIVEKSLLINFEKLVDKINNEVIISGSLEWGIADSEYSEGFVVRSTGKVQSQYSDYKILTVEIEEGFAYRASAVMGVSGVQALATFYDANGTRIGHTTDYVDNTAEYTYYYQTPIEIPQGAKSFKVCSHEFEYSKWGGYISVEKAPIEDSTGLFKHTERLTEFINNNHYLKDKVIVNFGDSIFGNPPEKADISSKLAEITGAKVYNCAFGGCRMGKHSEGYTDFSMYALADAVATGDFSKQDASLLKVDIGRASKHLENLKGLDFNTVDIITIAYGTNDFTGDLAVDDAENPINTGTFGGALRYSIETLLTAYPHLKVFVCTPIWRFWLTNGAFDSDSDTKTISGKKLTDFVEKAKEICKEYHIPCIDNYYELGFNKFNRSQYFPTTDGTHPNDTGRKLIAEHIANKLF